MALSAVQKLLYFFNENTLIVQSCDFCDYLTGDSYEFVAR